jgi:poly(3-hydroxybutyrate) depolymerase
MRWLITLALASCFHQPPPLPPGLASRCEATAAYVNCAARWREVTGRIVYYQTPKGTPPPAGWPVVFMFQGSYFGPDFGFYARASDPFGAYYQALTTKRLLDAGFAIVAPETHLGGMTFWDTNNPIFAGAWQRAPDDAFMRAIFDQIARGTFGPLDAQRFYACGISSGGYMASRMAVTYPARFHAIAIQSAAYASCSGLICHLPAVLPSGHPPTLFLHGARDHVVPIETMTSYRDQLEREGRATKTIIDPGAGHGWMRAAPDAIAAWFSSYP